MMKKAVIMWKIYKEKYGFYQRGKYFKQKGFKF